MRPGRFDGDSRLRRTAICLAYCSNPRFRAIWTRPDLLPTSGTARAFLHREPPRRRHYDRRPEPSPAEFRMCENTRISSVVVPGSIPGHRHDSNRVKVRHHVMRALIETAALPFVGTTFSSEAIHRSRVVAPDESDVAGRRSTEIDPSPGSLGTPVGPLRRSRSATIPLSTPSGLERSRLTSRVFPSGCRSKRTKSTSSEVH